MDGLDQKLLSLRRSVERRVNIELTRAPRARPVENTPRPVGDAVSSTSTTPQPAPAPAPAPLASSTLSSQTLWARVTEFAARFRR
jgi:hypothetical protein